MGSLRRPSTVVSAAVCAAVVAAIAPALHAQDLLDPLTPPHIAVVDGSATIDRDGQSQPAAASMPVVPGDRFRTGRGRLDILFPDGSALDVDENSAVEFQAPTLFRVTAGRVMLIVAGVNSPSGAPTFQIDTPVASATTDGPGEYRIAVLPAPSGVQTELAVMRGAGTLTTERGSMSVGPGERTVAWDDMAPSLRQAFNSARRDAFDQWAAARRDERLGSATSAQYLPPDLRMYGGTFERNGMWQEEPQYGQVWYPAVDQGWRPYYNGYWSSVQPYGWTWIGLDVWAWPTHHYGRWGYARNRWFWIPDRRWAPAWVSWGAAPGYVSWCPLGFDNRPVFGLSASVGTPWAGWVVLPRTHFGGRDYVHRYAVRPDTLPRNTPFVQHARAPLPPAHAVPRHVGGVSADAGHARPRGGFVYVNGDASVAGSTPAQPSVGMPGRARERGGVAGLPGERAGAPAPPPQGSQEPGGFRVPLPDGGRARDRGNGPASLTPDAAASGRAMPRAVPVPAPPANGVAVPVRPGDPARAQPDTWRTAVPRWAPPPAAAAAVPPATPAAPATPRAPGPVGNGIPFGRQPPTAQAAPAAPPAASPRATAPQPAASQAAPAAPPTSPAPATVPRTERSGPASGQAAPRQNTGAAAPAQGRDAARQR